MSTLRVRRSTFKRLGQGDLAIYASNVFERMTKLPDYQAFAADITLLGERINTFKNSLTNAASGGLDRIAVKNRAKEAVLKSLEDVARLLESYPSDEPTIITNIGMEINTGSPTRKPGVIIPQPMDLVAKSTGISGEVDITFKIVTPNLVRNHAIEISEDAGETWRVFSYTTSGKVRLQNLPSRPNLRIRVKSLGSFKRESTWAETQVTVL